MALSTDHLLRRGCFDPEQWVQVGNHGTKREVALRLYTEAIKVHGERLATGSDDFTIQLVELPSRDPIRQMTGHQQPVVHVQFSPSTRYLISGSFDKSIKLWDGYSG
jgi:ribosome assembly protein 4